MVLGYVDSLHVNNATARRYLSAIRAFSEYLILVEGIDPAEVYVPARVVRRTGRTFRPYVFTKNEVASLLRAAEQYEPGKTGPVFLNKSGGRITDSGIDYILKKYAALAAEKEPTL